MNDEQIKHMVNRFLAWKLPANFNPDAGITFTPEFNVEWNAKHGNPPQRHEPTGTNLFGYEEAEAMVRHMLEGLPAMTKATGSSELVERLREGVQALYHEPGQSTPIYAIVPANQTMRKAADRITDLEARLARAEEAIFDMLVAAYTEGATDVHMHLNGKETEGKADFKEAAHDYAHWALEQAALQENDRG